MGKHELVVIGGSAGGIQAAICAQRLQGLKDVMVVRREKTVMVPCGIPYIFGTLGAVEKNVMPDRLLGDAQLTIGEAVSLNCEGKAVTLEDGEIMGYNKLVLATGSDPLTPKIDGLDKKNIFLVNKDTDHLQAMANAMENAKHVVVIGGGFIGIEFADECRKNGREVTVVELLNHCLQLVCPETLCIRAEEVLAERGIDVITGTSVTSIGGEDEVEFVQLNDGREIRCDIVIIGIGVAPNTRLAEEAGLGIGPTGGIRVDEFQRTSAPDIFAVGDCAETYSFFNGDPVPVRLASVATREGRIAAANLYSSRWRNIGTVGVFSTVIGDMAIAMAGLDAHRAEELGYSVVVGEAEAPSKHPGTMPDASLMRVNLAFDRRSGKLLGGCACCTTAVGEVANLIAAGIVSGMTVEQIALFPMGTHPWLTASPLAYQFTEAAVDALRKVSVTS